MFNPVLNKVLTGTLLLAAMSLSACAKKGDISSRVAGRAPVTSTPQVTPNNCSNPNMIWGKIFDPHGGYTNQFEHQVKGFISATMNPDQFGTISGDINARTGIDVNTSFAFDGAGKLIPEQSTVAIKIVDSYVGQVYNGTAVLPYMVEFSAAKEGFYDRGTQQVQVVFEDQFGSITFQGMVKGTIVEGTVFYNNKNMVAGGYSASGSLGAFRTYTCATIH